MLDAISLSLSALIAPVGYTLPPEHRPIVIPASVQDAFRADWQALHGDWLAVGNDLAKAAGKVTENGKTESSA